MFVYVIRLPFCKSEFWSYRLFRKMIQRLQTHEGNNKCCVSSLRVILWPPPGLPTNYYCPSYCCPPTAICFLSKRPQQIKLFSEFLAQLFSPSDFLMLRELIWIPTFSSGCHILFYHSRFCATVVALLTRTYQLSFSSCSRIVIFANKNHSPLINITSKIRH